MKEFEFLEERSKQIKEEIKQRKKWKKELQISNRACNGIELEDI